jgi:hypothetical protein
MSVNMMAASLRSSVDSVGITLFNDYLSK